MNHSCPDRLAPRVEALFERLGRRIRHHGRRERERARRPFVTLAYAQSVDGSIAREAGPRLYLSGDESLRATHGLRAMLDGILVGVETILSDDPLLNVRLVEGASPRPIVLDSALRISDRAQVLEAGRGALLLTTERSKPERRAALVRRGVEIAVVRADARGQVELSNALEELRLRDIRTLMVEGGHRVLSSFIGQRLAQHLVLTICPIVVGGLTLGQADPLRRSGDLRLYDTTFVAAGQDILLSAALEVVERALPPETTA